LRLPTLCGHAQGLRAFARIGAQVLRRRARPACGGRWSGSRPRRQRSQGAACP